MPSLNSLLDLIVGGTKTGNGLLIVPSADGKNLIKTFLQDRGAGELVLDHRSVKVLQFTLDFTHTFPNSISDHALLDLADLFAKYAFVVFGSLGPINKSETRLFGTKGSSPENGCYLRRHS